MIGRIKGYLLAKTPPLILLDCQGVGYEIEVPMTPHYTRRCASIVWVCDSSRKANV